MTLTVEELRKNLLFAFELGKAYWAQIDSDSDALFDKANGTLRKCVALIEETERLFLEPSPEEIREAMRAGYRRGMQQDGDTANASDERALAYARTLAIALHRDHYATTAPQWKPFDDLYGILTQIDNMICGLAANASGDELTDEQILLIAKHHFKEGHATTPTTLKAYCDSVRAIITSYDLVAAPIASALPALIIKKGIRDGNWQTYIVNDHYEMIRVVARMEHDDEDLALGKLVEAFLLGALPAAQPKEPS